MKKKLLLISFACCMLHPSFSQNPLIKKWDKRFGGISEDGVYAFQQTKDGGYILGGDSYSDSSGDKTQNNWDASLQTADFWVVKIDSLGIKQWDKRFGGTDDDYILSLQQTNDGGYILGGSSNSDSSGDKTQDAWGIYDYWIVKIDSLGNKQWDKRFGGTANEELYSVQQTTDGGYILGGYSYSDSSGDKTQHSWGVSDYWMVKTDSLGIKQWDKRFGGTGYDEAYSLEQTSDGGYIIGGYSNSGGTGDATQTNWGGWDYWIVKTDAFGIKQWDKRFGGIGDDILYALHQSNDGGYILTGCSTSDSTGDKTGHNWDASLFTYDYWMIKIDSQGNKQWDKDFGGIADEDLVGTISQTNDEGFLLCGMSYSNISGNKTEDNLGASQAWNVKTDSIGNLKWEKTILTGGHDEFGYAIQTSDGCYAIVTGTAGGIAGYKTQPNWDTICIPVCTNDYWIVKFCDSTITENINLPDVSSMTFNIYPNPANKIITITVGKSENIIVFNLFGEILLNKKLSISKGGKIELNISQLSDGIYFIRAGNEVRKFVKQSH